MRTSALKAIGGLGPELDEDLSTTMMFTSHGYKGIYSMDTIALGHGPETFESAMIQERQWSRSAVILHFRWRHIVHATYKHFTLNLWIRACTTLFWYLSQMAWLTWLLTGAVVGYYTNWCTNSDEACNFSLINLLLRSFPAMLLAYAHIMWCRRRGWLRNGKLDDPPPPMMAPTVAVYRILRIVYMSLGVLAGFKELIFKKSSPFHVTPKGSNHVPVLSLRTLQAIIVIYLFLGAAFWAQFGWKDPADMGTPIFIFITAVGAVVFLLLIIGMHFWENGMASARNTAAHAVLLTLCVGGLVTTSVLQSDVIFNEATAKMFIPTMIFPYELVVMASFYGVVALYMAFVIFIV